MLGTVEHTETTLEHTQGKGMIQRDFSLMVAGPGGLPRALLCKGNSGFSGNRSPVSRQCVTRRIGNPGPRRIGGWNEHS